MLVAVVGISTVCVSKPIKLLLNIMKLILFAFLEGIQLQERMQGVSKVSGNPSWSTVLNY